MIYCGYMQPQDAKGEGSLVVRFPPSPTGNLHVGSARTAIFNWLFARRYGGKIVLRYEDTDKARSKPEYEVNIREGLVALGIDCDEGWDTLIRQSERTETYRSYIEKLIAADKAYISKEPAKDEPGREVEVVRLKNPNQSITFHDEVRGDITFDTTELGDIVIAKSFDEPLYHLTVVVDDFEMGITHVIRGEDHISNTPRQILIQEAIGAPRPIYAHIPLLLAPDRLKLSKRHGAVAVTEYLNEGYLPEALFNYLALLGFSPSIEKEIFTREELVQEFDLSRVHKSGAIFDVEKLRWMNREHLLRLTDDAFFSLVETRLQQSADHLPGFTEAMARRLLSLFRERVMVLSDIERMAREGELGFFFHDPEYPAQKLLWKEEGGESTAARLTKAAELLDEVDTFDGEAIRAAWMPYAEREGRGAVLWPVRFALSGRDASPDPFFIAATIGKEATVRRLEKAVRLLKAE
jgi:glutamyl-tRNA synthetase